MILITDLITMENEITALIELEAELTKSKAALAECKEQLNLLTEQSLLAILIVQDNKVVYANRAYAQLSGYDLKELLNWTTDDTIKLIHPDYRSFVFIQGQKKMRGEKEGIVNNYQYIGINKTGEEHWVDQYSKTILFNGKPADMISIINITDRVKAETALKKGREKYQALVNNVNDSILILQDGKIVFYNTTFEREIGYSAEEIKEMSLLDLIHPEDQHIVIDRYNRRLAGEAIPSTYSYRTVLKTKDIVWTQVNAVIIDWEGKPATLCVIRDINKIKELENRVQESRKLEAISTLAGGLAHKFNNILFPIIGLSELLMEDTSEGNSIHDGLSQILKAANRGRDIVKQFMAFSRELDQETEVFDLKPVLRDVLKIIKASSPSTIEIHFDISAPCGPVRANPTQLHQVLLNLCTNAFQAMEETGGRFDIRLAVKNLGRSELENTKMAPGLYACLILSDTGSGMEKSILDRIFDPYFTTKEQGKGSGMGLSVALGTIKNYGGDIQVESEPGKGSTFKIFLPIFEAVSDGWNQD